MACSENKTRPMVETTHRDILERRRGEGGGGLEPGALGFGLTFPIPKRALRAHGLPPWGSSAPAHLTHPTAMQPAGGAHASSSSVHRLIPSVAVLQQG